MEENTIVQFVGFITNLDFNKFVEQWDYYVHQLNNSQQKPTLQKLTGSKSRFKYISQHPCAQGDFKFAFMNKRDSTHFPEHSVRVVHAGGYIPVQIQASRKDKEKYINIMVLVKNQEINLEFYRHLQLFRKLNIFQAYYENCAYSYIMEFFVKEADAASFILQLNPGNINPHFSDEVAMYEEYGVIHA
jgi:hypothetical protein